MRTLTQAASAALESAVQRSSARLVIETKTGVRIQVDENGILAGSLSISNQCAEGNELSLGSAYIGELDVSILPSVANRVPRSAMQGATVTVFLAYADMDMQLGVFTVDEAEWSSSGVALTCYDAMAKATAAYDGGELDGSPHSLLAFACSTCGIMFGMTAAQVSAFPNASERIRVYGESDISEWRDLIGWIAQTLCAFATIDHEGKLVLRRYGYSPVATLDARRRTDSSKFSSFATRYTGLSYVNIADQTTVYVGLAQDDGLTMNLGQNPFLQYGIDVKKTRMVRAILTELARGAWVPFEVELPYLPPVYELGDCIEFTGRYAGDSSTACVMGIEWTSHRGLKLRGYGSDPALANGKSKLDKEISGILSRVGKDSVEYYPYVNTIPYTVGSRVAILQIDYASLADGTVEFHCNIDLKATGNVVTTDTTKTYKRTKMTVEYELNGEILETQPIDSYTDGWHIVHLFRPLGVNEGEFNELRVILTATDGIINIGIGGVRAIVSGKGLAANDGEWRSTQSFYEQVDFSLLGSLAVDVSESLSTSFETPIPQGIGESVSFSLLGSLVAGFTESVGGSDYTAASHNTTLSGGVTYTNGSFVAGSAGTIVTEDMGADAAVTGIEGLSCVYSGTVRIECDFGDGYRQWNGSGWASSTGGNIPSTLEGLTIAQWAQGYTDSLVLRINMEQGAVVNALSVGFTDDWS